MPWKVQNVAWFLRTGSFSVPAVWLAWTSPGFIWKPHLAVWIDVSLAMAYQHWELTEPELENMLHPLLLLLVSLLASKKILTSIELSSLLLFITGKLRRSLVFVSTSLVGVIWVASVYLFHTHTVCLAWQPAGVDNNKASVEVSKQLMAWGTEGTPTVAACNLPGWWSHQARTKASLFAGCLEINVWVVFVSLCLSLGWKEPAGPAVHGVVPGEYPFQRLTWLSYYHWWVWKESECFCLNRLKSLTENS